MNTTTPPNDLREALERIKALSLPTIRIENPRLNLDGVWDIADAAIRAAEAIEASAHATLTTDVDAARERDRVAFEASGGGATGWTRDRDIPAPRDGSLVDLLLDTDEVVTGARWGEGPPDESDWADPEGWVLPSGSWARGEDETVICWRPSEPLTSAASVGDERLTDVDREWDAGPSGTVFDATMPNNHETIQLSRNPGQLPPPVEQAPASGGVRERVARLLEPMAWAQLDGCLARDPNVDPDRVVFALDRAESLTLADQIIASLPDRGGGWRDRRQRDVAEWCRVAFGDAQMASLEHRGLRFLEAAIEAYQACGCDVVVAHKLLDFVFARPVGALNQELGGVGVTLLALAQTARLSADAEEQREFGRVLAKPISHFTKRNAEKDAAGFRASDLPSPPQDAPDGISEVTGG